MSSEVGQRHLGRKIWYGIAIALCVLVILVSAACVVGTWVAGNALSSAAVQLLLVVENTAGGLSSAVDRIDQGISRLETTSTAISDATSQLSQNVSDKGLVLTLLPEQREQELVSQADELQQSLESILASLRAGLELYRSIDSLPFVSLPRPEPETVERLEQSVSGIQDNVAQVVQGIQDFRLGVSEEIGRVTSLLDEITAGLVEARQTLAGLNDRLEALQALAERLQTLVPLIFTLLSVFGTLIFSWVIYTEVEVIRLHRRRWKDLKAVPAAVLPPESLPTGEPPEMVEQPSPGAPEAGEQQPEEPQPESPAPEEPGVGDDPLITPDK